MTRRFSQMHRTDKYSEQSSIILASLAKWLSDCLQTKWFWVQVQLQSLKDFVFATIKQNQELAQKKLISLHLTVFVFEEHILIVIITIR